MRKIAYQIEWTYKGHTILIEEEKEVDNILHWIYVTKPDGERVFADVSTDEDAKQTVELWIDAGYPLRVGGGPWELASLKKLMMNEIHRNHRYSIFFSTGGHETFNTYYQACLKAKEYLEEHQDALVEMRFDSMDTSPFQGGKIGSSYFKYLPPTGIQRTW